MSEKKRRPSNATGRAEILAVARGLFMIRGYRAVSTRDIARAVGLTQPALYHHFGGKEALYVAVLEDELAIRSAEMWTAARLETSATDRLAALATRIGQRADYDLAQMFHDLRFEISEENRRRIGLAFRESMMMPMLAVVNALVEEGAIAPERAGLDRFEAVRFILSVVRMLTESHSGTRPGRERSPEEIGEMTVRLVLNGLGSLTTR